MTAAERYIIDNWKKTVHRFEKKEAGKVYLPKPYNTPCITGNFKDLFYWDTYFINLGLLAMGEFEMAENNLDDFAHLVEELGFIPNANLICMLDRSQPPLFCRAVDDLYRTTGSARIVEKFLPFIEKEYLNFLSWHSTDTGLARYSCLTTDAELLDFFDLIVRRLKIKKDITDPIGQARHWMAEAESGWDFTPRFGSEAHNYLAVDLNGLLYGTERLLSEYFAVSGNGEKAREYEKRAEQRKALCNRFLLTPDGIYKDYNFVKGEFGPYYTTASFVPFAVGMADDKESAKKLLSVLECEHGVAASEYYIGDVVYQWGYPNMWAPLTYFVIDGLMRCNLTEDARRVAEKYVSAVDAGYERHNILFEKYDATTGMESYYNEYNVCEMMGWTAGVYMWAKKKFTL